MDKSIRILKIYRGESDFDVKIYNGEGDIEVEGEAVDRYIYTDDTIQTIRKKIFAFLSTEKDLLIEQNQELWIKTCEKKLKILGPTWTNIYPEPSFLQKVIEPDHKRFVSKNGQMILVEHIRITTTPQKFPKDSLQTVGDL